MSTNRDQDGNYSGKVNNLRVTLDSADIQNPLSFYETDHDKQNYYAEAISGTAGTKGTKDAEASALILSKNVIEAVLGQNAQVILTDSGNMDMHATDDAATRVVSGSGYTTGDRQDAAILINRDSVKTETGKGASVDAAGSASQHAGISGETQVFSVSADSGTYGILPVISRKLNLLMNETRVQSTVEDGATVTSHSNGKSNSSISITSGTALDLLSLSENGAASSGSGVTGATASYIRDGSQANTRIGDGATLTGTNTVEITAEVLNDLTSGITSRAAAGTTEPAGNMNLILTASAATVDAGEQTDITSQNQDISIQAVSGKTNSGSRLMNVTISPDNALGTALGGSFNINLLNSTAAVNLQSGALKARKNVSVLASGDQKSQLAGLTAAAGGEGLTAEG